MVRRRARYLAVAARRYRGAEDGRGPRGNLFDIEGGVDGAGLCDSGKKRFEQIGVGTRTKVLPNRACRRNCPRVCAPRYSTISSHPVTRVTFMGRPRFYDEPRVTTAIRLQASLHNDLPTAAVTRDVSANFLVTRAVSDYLRTLPLPNVDEPLERRRQSRRPPEKVAS